MPQLWVETRMKYATFEVQMDTDFCWIKSFHLYSVCAHFHIKQYARSVKNVTRAAVQVYK